MHLQGKFLINIIKLMIRCRFLPLNVDSFFDFKLKSCGSVIYIILSIIQNWRWQKNCQNMFLKRLTPEDINIGMLCKQELLFGGGWITWNIASDVYILTNGKKSINVEKNENGELTDTQVFRGRLCVLYE